VLIQNVNRVKEIALQPSARGSTKKRHSTTLSRTPFRHLTQSPLNNPLHLLRIMTESMITPADITFSIDWEAGEATFSASTPQAKQWMGCTKKTVPLADAKTFRETAEAAGLRVTAFP
jgi:hypothetical protein